MKKHILRLVLTIAFLVLARLVLSPASPVGDATSTPVAEGQQTAPRSNALRRAADAHRSNIEVETGGRVTRLLPDDTEGSRHEKFLIRTSDSLSIMVVYNIDLAPRVPVQVGDSVTLRGEYIWNDRGGLIHWTHHDPAQRHEAGWVEVKGRRYQ